MLLERESEPKRLDADSEPVSYFERNDDLDIEGYVDLMEFRLVYQGALPGSGNNTRHTEEKHRIRKQLHKQLAGLWASHPLLVIMQRTMTQPLGNPNMNPLNRYALKMHGFRFLPLVFERMQQACALDILLLRRERPGALITQGGDIDNRIKTLFDALCIPKSPNGLTVPEPDEDPFYCVLEEDKLVTTVKVTADRLLALPVGQEPRNYVHAIIGVKITVPTDFAWAGQYYTPRWKDDFSG